MSDETGNSRGFGYVMFNDIEEATNAMKALDGKSIGDDTPLRVNFAAPVKERRVGYVARGGRDRRGGGGGGGGGARGWGAGDDPNRSSYGSPRRSDRGGKLPYQTREYKQERRERKEQQDYY